MIVAISTVSNKDENKVPSQITGNRDEPAEFVLRYVVHLGVVSV